MFQTFIAQMMKMVLSKYVYDDRTLFLLCIYFEKLKVKSDTFAAFSDNIVKLCDVEHR